MSDTYEATFTWPAGPKEVIITGTFDNWSSSTKLIRSWEGSFSYTLKFPWGEKILYKYIVDGQWVTSRHEKTETDANGNVNNVFRAPPRPATPTTAAPAVKQEPIEAAPASAPSEPEPQPVVDASAKDAIVETLASVKDSALATEGVHPPTVAGYVASAVGAAIATVTGMDPINAPKVPLGSPEAKAYMETDLDLSPAASHGKPAAYANGTALHEKLPSLLPAAADKAVEEATITSAEGLPSLLPAASEPTPAVPIAIPTKTEAPPPEPVAAAAVPEPTPVPTVTETVAPAPISEPEPVATPPVAAEPTPAPKEASTPAPATKPTPTTTITAKQPEPTKTETEHKVTASSSTAASTSPTKEKVSAKEDIARHGSISSAHGSQLKNSLRKKRPSILVRIKNVLHLSDKEKEEKEEKLKK